MSDKEAQELLKIAKEQVPQGIYAVEKDNKIELHRGKLSKTQMKELRREYRQAGYKVYCNGL